MAKKKRKNSSVGRPLWLPTDKQIKEAETLAARGLTQQEIADYFNVALSTLQLRKKEISEFSDAIARGRSKGTAVVAGALLERAKNGDMDAIKFYLIYMAGRKEIKRVENTDGDGNPIKITLKIPKGNE